jgi:hypothetical protein
VKQWAHQLSKYPNTDLQSTIGIMGRIERTREIARRRTRRSKLKKLRKSYTKANGQREKEEILEKARKISPFANLEESGN